MRRIELTRNEMEALVLQVEAGLKSLSTARAHVQQVYDDAVQEIRRKESELMKKCPHPPDRLTYNQGAYCRDSYYRCQVCGAECDAGTFKRELVIK